MSGKHRKPSMRQLYDDIERYGENVTGAETDPEFAKYIDWEQKRKMKEMEKKQETLLGRKIREPDRYSKTKFVPGSGAVERHEFDGTDMGDEEQSDLENLFPPSGGAGRGPRGGGGRKLRRSRSKSKKSLRKKKGSRRSRR